MLSTTFTLFPVVSLQVRPHKIKVSLPPLYLYCLSREKKYQALHMPAQEQCSCSGVWEPYEAKRSWCSLPFIFL